MGTEVITYSRIGKEDINFGIGTFEVVLADGRKVTLSKVDLGAILNTASLSSPMFPHWYTLTNYDGVVADGVNDDTEGIEECLDEAEAAGGGLIFVPFGTYTYATSPNFARPGVSLWCVPGATFKHTGTGNAFTLDGGASGSGILGNRYDNLTVQGNALSTNGLYVRSIHHSDFMRPRVKGCATTGAGMLLEWCVANTWITPIVSVNTGGLSPIPKYGMHLSRRGSGTDHSTTNVVLSPIFEGLTQSSGAGIYIDYAAKNEFNGGTSESNTHGIYITGDSGVGNNTFRSLFLEANSSSDLTLDGAVYQSFYDLTSAAGVTITNNAGYCRFYGGVLDDTTIASTADYIRFRDVIFASGSTLTNSSDTTMFYDCVGAGGTLITNRSAHTVVDTADLPAAATAQDGKMVIENSGAGTASAVFYKGGKRWKVSLTES